MKKFLLSTLVVILIAFNLNDPESGYKVFCGDVIGTACLKEPLDLHFQ